MAASAPSALAMDRWLAPAHETAEIRQLGIRVDANRAVWLRRVVSRTDCAAKVMSAVGKQTRNGEPLALLAVYLDVADGSMNRPEVDIRESKRHPSREMGQCAICTKWRNITLPNLCSRRRMSRRFPWIQNYRPSRLGRFPGTPLRVAWPPFASPFLSAIFGMWRPNAAFCLSPS